VPHAALREPLHEALQSHWRQEAFYPIQIAVQQAGLGLGVGVRVTTSHTAGGLGGGDGAAAMEGLALH